jgi:hypothetical protein
MLNRALSTAAAAALAPLATADITVHGVTVPRWGLEGARLGLEGATVERFEDAALAPGLLVRVTTGNGSYGPTSTLPNVFDTRVDPFGTAFRDMQWDGVGALVNTRTNQPLFYNDGNNWGDVEFTFTTPARVVGFSVAQREAAARLIVNGVDRGELGALAGFPTSGGHGGYVVIEATGNDTIATVLVDNQGGDGIVFDHLAFSADPMPSISVTGILPGAWGATNAELGVQGAVVEDFEDAALIPRLTVQWDCPAETTAPSGTLPAVFHPATDDPFGNAFDQGVWDGTGCLTSGAENRTWNYADGTHWGDLVLSFDPPAFSVGFSLADFEGEARLIVNGRDVGGVHALSGLPYASSGRSGYLRVDSREGAAIASIRLANNRVGPFGDGFVLDHLAVRGCGADFNGDGFLDFFDYDDFVNCFETSTCPPGQSADFNGDGFADFFDYDDYVSAFESGC